MVRIGLWGTFDVQNYGDALFPRIGRAELAGRLPGATVRAFSPLGPDHPTRFDGGDTPEALGRYSPERLARLVEELDCVVVGGGEIIHDHDWELAPHYGRTAEELESLAPSRFFIDGLGPELEEECPVLWHAVGLPFDIPEEQRERYREAITGRPYVSVRDQVSKERLEALGIGREIALVPDPAVLLPRFLSTDALDRRLRYLRAIGGYPVRGEALAVQGSRVLLQWVDELAAAIDGLATELGVPLAVVETGPSHGDGEFAEALSARVGSEVFRASDVGPEDIAAVIAGSIGFVGNSLHGNITAFAFGRPHVVLGLNRESKLLGFVRLIEDPDCLAERADEVAAAFRASAEADRRGEIRAALTRRIDRHFDHLAEIAAHAAARRVRPRARARSAQESQAQVMALRHAFEARGRRLALQRWRMADRVAQLEEQERERRRQLEATIAELRETNEFLQRELEGTRGELRSVLSTKTFRYTAPLRRAWSRIRRPRGQP
jgi:polysaccharide pyruvyl transferase WcaK-like protein